MYNIFVRVGHDESPTSSLSMLKARFKNKWVIFYPMLCCQQNELLHSKISNNNAKFIRLPPRKCNLTALLLYMIHLTKSCIVSYHFFRKFLKLVMYDIFARVVHNKSPTLSLAMLKARFKNTWFKHFFTPSSAANKMNCCTERECNWLHFY
jgi:hypothetical protein